MRRWKPALTIPMLPGLRSLNVALACAMVTGEALRQLGLRPVSLLCEVNPFQLRPDAAKGILEGGGGAGGVGHLLGGGAVLKDLGDVRSR